jgi:protease-4
MSTRRGVLAFVLLVVVLGVVVLISALRLRHPSGSPAAVSSTSSNSLLVFRVPDELEEAEVPLRSLFAVSAVRRSRLTTYDVANGLRRAAHDDRVSGLVLHIDGIDWGWGKIAEIRDALLEFRREGKPVYAALTGGAEREYLLASAANVVSLPPTASLDLDGLTLSTLHFKGTFDKLGITPNFAHVGQYKSAVEGYTRTEMSPPARAALEAVLDDEYRLLCDTLASARHTTAAAIASTIDDGPFLATEARARGLIDTLLHVEDVDSLAIRGGGKDLNPETFDHYLDRLDEPRTGPRIALVVAAGAIVPGRSRESPGQGRELGSLTLIQALREARTRRSIKAIVLRIDSPGGSAQATDDIWNEIARCRRVKPVIVSMADYGASGGYYMAIGGDSIVAQPATLTGSIGIFGGKLNVLGLYHKLGLNVETLSRGRHAEMLSAFRDFTPEEAAKFQHILEDFYRGFVARVANARHRPTEAIETVAQGRVWTGVSARHEGLVDALGGFETAFAMARAKAGIPRGASIVVERLPKVQRTFLQRLLEELVGDEDDYGVETLAPEFQGLLRAPGVQAMLKEPEVQAWLAAVSFRAGDGLMMMPFAIDIR